MIVNPELHTNCIDFFVGIYSEVSIDNDQVWINCQNLNLTVNSEI
jgi:hypothetical protein